MKEIEGFKELVEQAKKMGERAAKERKAALYEGIQVFQKEVVKNAPRNKGEPTDSERRYGTLKENITLRWDEETETSYVTDGDAYWSHFLEFGTVYQRPQPFWERSFHKSRDEAQRAVAKALKRRLGL